MTHAIVNKEETRKLREIVEIVNVNPDGVAITNTPFTWNPRDDRFYFKKSSRVFEKIAKRYGIRTEGLEEEFKKRVRVLYQLLLKKKLKFDETQDIINKYYKRPIEVLKELGIQ
jgi:hypothetical protein